MYINHACKEYNDQSEISKVNMVSLGEKSFSMKYHEFASDSMTPWRSRVVNCEHSEIPPCVISHRI